MEEKKEKEKKKKIFYLIPILVFLGFIFYEGIRSFPGEVHAEVAHTTLSTQGLEALSDSYEETLQDNIYGKDEYINLSGLATRILGINSLKEKQKQKNGHLSGFASSHEETVLQCAENVIDLNEFLETRGIDFLYLLAPNEVDFYGAEFAPGYESDEYRKDVELMTAQLSESDVTFIDMDSWFEENAWDMDDVFYKTDHHWKAEAALAAAQVTMEVLDQNGEAYYDGESLDDKSYNIQVLENGYLGSHGDSVGRYYAGLDDFSIYFPDFGTNYSYSGLKRDTSDWTYTDSPLDLDWLDDRKGYYNSGLYCVYMYGNNPLQIVTNSEAANQERVLIIGNSFKLPYEYFMTTQFQEVYTIDIRTYTDGTFVQYVEDIQPDIVIMCTHNTSDLDELYLFGTEEYLSALETTAEETPGDILPEVSIDAQGDNNNYFTVLYNNLEPGQTYTLTVDSTAYSGGEDQFVQMTLQDLSNNTAIYNRYFDANSNETQRWIFTVPEGTDNYAVYLYAGTKGHTQNAMAEVSDIILYEGITEN